MKAIVVALLMLPLPAVCLADKAAESIMVLMPKPGTALHNDFCTDLDGAARSLAALLAAAQKASPDHASSTANKLFDETWAVMLVEKIAQCPGGADFDKAVGMLPGGK